MALLERNWPAASAALTADGDATGVLTVGSTSGFYSGQLVQLFGTGLTTKNLKVLEVISATQMRVGPVSQSYEGSGTDCAGFTTGLSSTVAAKVQPKVFPGDDEVVAVVYESQPTTALRVMTVDRQGNYVTAGSGSAASVSVTNTVSITSALTSATFQYIKVASTSVTAGNASVTQAFPSGTISGNARIFTCVSTFNSNVGISLNGSQIQELGNNESFSYDLATNGRQINSSTTIGVWNISATSTSGSLRFSMVS